MDFISRLIRRWNNPNAYINIFTWKDSNKGQIHDVYFKAVKENIDQIERTIKELNKRGTAVGYCINPLKSNKRSEENVDRITQIFVDVDGGMIEENFEKTYMEISRLGMEPYYVAGSGSGYHFNFDVDLPATSIHLIKNFIKHLNTINKNVDLKVSNISRIQRLPKTKNFKHNQKGDEVKVLHFEEEINQDKTNKNTDVLNSFTKETKEVKKIDTDNAKEVAEHLAKKDVFFTELLKDEAAMLYLSKKDGIGKNDNLFKNLAIFDFNTDEKYHDEIVAFVELCGHIEQEYDGWLRKASSLEINYDEIRNWINDNNLEPLKPLIREQMNFETNFLDRWKFAYMEGREGDYRYLAYDTKKDYFSYHTLSKLKEMIHIKSRAQNVFFEEAFGLIFMDEWGKMSLGQKENMIRSKIWEKIFYAQKLPDIYDVGSKPVKDRFFEDGGKVYFNEYKPGLYEYYFVEKEVYKFPNIKLLILHLCGGDEKGYQFVIKYLAFVLQNPTEKLPSSILFYGTSGIGKGRLRHWILNNIWGENNIKEIDQGSLEQIWGDYLVGARWVIANEIVFNPKSQTKISQKVKNHSTDPRITVNLKGRDQQDIANFSHWLFFADQEHPLKIEEQDRRFTVFKQPRPINKDITNNLGKDETLHNELKDFVSYLRTVDVKFQDVQMPYENDSRKELISMNKDTVDQFLEELWEHENFQQFMHDNCLQYNSKTYEQIVITGEFHTLYRTWCTKNGLDHPYQMVRFGQILKVRYNIESARSKKLEPTHKKFFYLKDIMEAKKK